MAKISESGARRESTPGKIAARTERIEKYKWSDNARWKQIQRGTQFIKERLPYECIIMLTQTQPDPDGPKKSSRKNVVLHAMVVNANDMALSINTPPGNSISEVVPWSMIKKIIPISVYDKSPEHTAGQATD